MNRQKIYDAINRERNRQIEKYGNQESRTNGRWLAVLVSEIGESAGCLLHGQDRELLVNGIVQIAAVAVAWLEEKF